MSPLRDRFASLLRRLGATGDASATVGAVLAAWSEPARTYHGLPHLEDCLARLDELPAHAGWRDAVEAALWFHDAVCDPRADDNESRSAEWAQRALSDLGIPGDLPARVADLVRLTRHDAPAADEAGRILCDLDLSILGRGPAEFDAYDRSIRAEYPWLPDAVYSAGRRRVLAGFLARRPLYQTDWFRGRYETSARANLARALGAPEAP